MIRSEGPAPKQMEGPHPKNVLPAETCQLISEQNVFYLLL